MLRLWREADLSSESLIAEKVGILRSRLISRSDDVFIVLFSGLHISDYDRASDDFPVESQIADLQRVFIGATCSVVTAMT
jgi:hypothetical protein